MTKPKQESKGNNDISTAASSTSIDQTVASEVSLDRTCYSEGLGTCASEVDLKTATGGLATCHDQENMDGDERTCRSVDSSRTTKTARGKDDLKTATDGSSTTHTARHRSAEDLKTATDGSSTTHTARHRSAEDLKTATDGSSTTRTARGQTESVEQIVTAIDHADGTRTAITKSEEGLRTCRVNSVATCHSKEDVQTAASDVLTAMKEVDVQTSRNIESNLGSSRSEENLRTANDAALRTAARSSKSEDLITGIEDGADITTALSSIATRTAGIITTSSQESITTALSSIATHTAGVITTCSQESTRTANDLDEEQLKALTNYESEYCMDVTPETATSNLLIGAPSQYQLSELRNYSALNDPATAYQYKIQEALPPNHAKSVSATESEYCMDVTGSN